MGNNCIVCDGIDNIKGNQNTTSDADTIDNRLLPNAQDWHNTWKESRG